MHKRLQMQTFSSLTQFWIKYFNFTPLITIDEDQSYINDGFKENYDNTNPNLLVVLKT